MGFARGRGLRRRCGDRTGIGFFERWRERRHDGVTRGEEWNRRLRTAAVRSTPSEAVWEGRGTDLGCVLSGRQRWGGFGLGLPGLMSCPCGAPADGERAAEPAGKPGFRCRIGDSAAGTWR